MSDKIVLVRPQNIYNYNNYPPLNLISIGTRLKQEGYEVVIINCAFEKDHLTTISEHVTDALFVGISFLTSEIPSTYEILKFVKKNFKVPIVVGGWHCTLFPEQMANCEYTDFVVVGEGEEHTVAIAKAIETGNWINSKIYGKDILNIETLPAPDYSLDRNIERFITGYLTDKLSEVATQPMRWLPYETSRGCPSRCTFCINTVTDNKRYRKKSAEKVIEEMECIVKKYCLTHVKIIDDNFFVDIKRVREICQGILEKGLNITWDGECRCDYFNETMLNDETLELCKRSGLVQLTLGIESGSSQTLDIMKKDITTEDAELAVMKCNQHAVIARSSFILEIPGEGIDDIKKTVAFINRLRKYEYFTCGVGTFRPYPKCELTERLIAEGYLKEPDSFDEWTDKTTIDMYTSVEYIRPWQVNGKYSESASYYLNMESEIRLGSHQIERWVDRIKNNIFIALAWMRNRFMFYRFPIDKELYKKFLLNFYRKRQELEKSGAYPLVDLKNE